MTDDAQPKKILIADDTDAIRKLLNFRLKKEGYEIIEAADGQEALKKFEEENPDLILLDIMMPKMFGWDVLQKIKESNPSVKVVVMTAVYKKSSYRIKTIHDYGADDYITKPFDLTKMVELVNSLLTS